MVVYYCWLCDKPADERLHDFHYETGRQIFFCSTGHQEAFFTLKML